MANRLDDILEGGESYGWLKDACSISAKQFAIRKFCDYKPQNLLIFHGIADIL